MLNQLEISRFDTLTNNEESYVVCMQNTKSLNVDNVVSVKSSNKINAKKLAVISKELEKEICYDFVGVAG